MIYEFVVHAIIMAFVLMVVMATLVLAPIVILLGLAGVLFGNNNTRHRTWSSTDSRRIRIGIRKKEGGAVFSPLGNGEAPSRGRRKA